MARYQIYDIDCKARLEVDTERPESVWIDGTEKPVTEWRALRQGCYFDPVHYLEITWPSGTICRFGGHGAKFKSITKPKS